MGHSSHCPEFLYLGEQYTRAQPLVFSVGLNRCRLLHSGWPRLSAAICFSMAGLGLGSTLSTAGQSYHRVQELPVILGGDPEPGLKGSKIRKRNSVTICR